MFWFWLVPVICGKSAENPRFGKNALARTHPHRRDDRFRHGGRPRQLFAGRHGRLHLEAGEDRGDREAVAM